MARKQYEKNVEVAEAEVDNPKDDLDLLLLGDSVVEFFTGSAIGVDLFPAQRLAYKKLLRGKKDGDVYGLALGVSGDRCPNLLFRVLNGELPAKLDPPIIWMVIGLNVS